MSIKLSAAAPIGFLALASIAGAQNVGPITGLWSGWHQCTNAQGTHKVSTSAFISADGTGRVTGVREFHPSPDDASRASGSFRVSGEYERSSGAITLNAGDWINHPDGYGKCDFVGKVEGNTIKGTSPHCAPACNEFELTRQ